MTVASRTKVAALQCLLSHDPAENLTRVMTQIDQAADAHASLLVLPALAVQGAFGATDEEIVAQRLQQTSPALHALREKALSRQVTLILHGWFGDEAGSIRAETIAIGPDGSVLGSSPTLVPGGLLPFEDPPASHNSAHGTALLQTSAGTLGVLAGLDGLRPEEAARAVAQGATLLVAPLRTFAADLTQLHLPARVAELGVALIAANAVGPLLPPEQVETFAQKTHASADLLVACGESLILGPDGQVLARAQHGVETILYAELDSQVTRPTRPDGTSRRQRLPQALSLPTALSAESRPTAAQRLEAAVFQPVLEGDRAVAELAYALKDIAAAKVQLLVLPELFCLEKGKVTDPARAAQRCKDALYALRMSLQRYAKEGMRMHIVTSVVEQEGSRFHHTGVVLGPEGVVFRQGQVTSSALHSAWHTPAAGLQLCSMPWGCLGLAVGEDALTPEILRTLAQAGAEVIAAPFHLQEAGDITQLLASSGENRLCLVAATRQSRQGASCLSTLWQELTLRTRWAKRPFDGHLASPLSIKAQSEPGLIRLTLHPAHAQQRDLWPGYSLLSFLPEPVMAAPDATVEEASSLTHLDASPSDEDSSAEGQDMAADQTVLETARDVAPAEEAPPAEAVRGDAPDPEPSAEEYPSTADEAAPQEAAAALADAEAAEAALPATELEATSDPIESPAPVESAEASETPPEEEATTEEAQ